MRIEEYLAGRAERVEAALRRVCDRMEEAVEARLLEAVRYSLLSGGKRIRPILLLAAAEAAGGDAERLFDVASSVEMVHTYSLIHDDLPAMDDDDFRRGRPSNHKVFGEAIAILAGDALLTDAFTVMSAPTTELPPALVVRAIHELASAAGGAGMVGGQTADILAEGDRADRSRIESIHRRKTGALLRAAIRIGGILGGADDRVLAALTHHGEAVGFAFQVADDLLDELGRTNETGKTAHRDRERGKSTVPAVLGVEGSRALLGELLDDGLAALAPFDDRADPLREIARFVVSRAL